MLLASDLVGVWALSERRWFWLKTLGRKSDIDSQTAKASNVVTHQTLSLPVGDYRPSSFLVRLAFL